jgi:hypothetical protein
MSIVRSTAIKRAPDENGRNFTAGISQSIDGSSDSPKIRFSMISGARKITTSADGTPRNSRPRPSPASV